MMYSPKEAIAKGWITLPEGVSYDEVVQPNAIDFTLDQLFGVSKTTFVLAKNFTSHRGVQEEVEAKPVTFGKGAGDFFELAPNTSYDAMSNFKVKLPEGVACTLIVRSSGNRNLMFITSGLYDSGYDNRIGFAIHNRSAGKAYLEKGVRIGQIIFHESKSEGLYAGQYNAPQAEGEHWTKSSISPLLAKPHPYAQEVVDQSATISDLFTPISAFTQEQLDEQAAREIERRAIVERLIADSTLPETVTTNAEAADFAFPTTETHGGGPAAVDPAPKSKTTKKRVAKKAAKPSLETNTDA